MMNVFPHKSHTVKRQTQWWAAPEVLFSSKYLLQVISFAICLAAMGGLLYVWQWSNFTNIGYRIQKLEKQHSTLKSQIELLEIEISYLKRPKRLESIAKKQLKLRPPKAQQLIIPKISSDEKVP